MFSEAVVLESADLVEAGLEDWIQDGIWRSERAAEFGKPPTGIETLGGMVWIMRMIYGLHDGSLHDEFTLTSRSFP